MNSGVIRRILKRPGFPAPLVTARNTLTITVLFLGGACVQVADIQRMEPIRTIAFTGSHVAVAHCIQARLRANVHEKPIPFGEAVTSKQTFVIYDTVRGYASRGLSHYSMTVKKIGANEGIVEWRIFNQQPGGYELDKTSVVRFWNPVERCIEEARRTS